MDRIVKGADGRKYITNEPEPKQEENDLRKAARAMLACVDYMLKSGEWFYAQERADALRSALSVTEEPKQDDKDAEIERLRKALYYEENRFQRIGTHAPDCWKWGPQHFECALRHIKELEAKIEKWSNHD